MKPPKPETIRALRQTYGLTQTEAGALLRVDILTWQAWEGGRVPMRETSWKVWQIRAARRHAAKHKP